MREIRQSGSEGGGASLRSPYPYRQRPKDFFISLLALRSSGSRSLQHILVDRL